VKSADAGNVYIEENNVRRLGLKLLQSLLTTSCFYHLESSRAQRNSQRQSDVCFVIDDHDSLAVSDTHESPRAEKVRNCTTTDHGF
jgi:hypothetical protein